MLALSAVLSTRVGRRRKFGEVSCTQCTIQEKDFEFIPKWKLEIPWRIILVMNFQRSVIVA